MGANGPTKAPSLFLAANDFPMIGPSDSIAACACCCSGVCSGGGIGGNRDIATAWLFTRC